MVRISIQAAHEQVNPTDLLNDVVVMDKYGIERCWTSDHYMPWWDSGASGGAAWPWMGAALAKTQRISIGTGVTAPILRYHPAVVAQVFASLAYMFPNRVFLGLGKGEALNEVTTGQDWPASPERFARLREAISLIKKLWTEDWVDFKGTYYWVKDSKLYTKPKQPIPIYIAGLGPKSAMLAGEEGNGFVTNELDTETIRSKLFPALESGTKISGRGFESIEKILFIPASYHEDKNRALQSIRFWSGSMTKEFFDADIHDPRKIEDEGRKVSDDTLEKKFLVISSADEAIKKLENYIKVGFTEIVLTNSSPDRSELIKLVAEKIIPHVIKS
jgi:coenzyme F420-dependent glucose-6-phosphate dehydrogenase